MTPEGKRYYFRTPLASGVLFNGFHAQTLVRQDLYSTLCKADEFVYVSVPETRQCEQT